MVEAPADLQGALSRLLYKVAVVPDLDAARTLVAEVPDVTAVTRDGDVFGAHFAHGGSATQPSLIEIQAAVEEATEALAEAVASSERLTFDTSRLEAERLDAQMRADVALARLHESDATLAAVAEELGQHGSLARSARAEAARVTEAITAAEEARDRDLAGLADLEQRLATAEDAPDEEPDTAARERLADAARASRQAEMEARLALRTSEERARALHGRADQLVRAAAAEREARAKAAERRERLVREGRAARRSCSRAGWCWPASTGRSTSRRRDAPRSSRAAPVARRSCCPSGRRCATWPASTTSWSAPSTATRWRAPSSGCASSSSRSGRSRSSVWSPRG